MKNYMNHYGKAMEKKTVLFVMLGISVGRSVSNFVKWTEPRLVVRMLQASRFLCPQPWPFLVVNHRCMQGSLLKIDAQVTDSLMIYLRTRVFYLSISFGFVWLETMRTRENEDKRLDAWGRCFPSFWLCGHRIPEQARHSQVQCRHSDSRMSGWLAKQCWNMASHDRNLWDLIWHAQSVLMQTV